MKLVGSEGSKSPALHWEKEQAQQGLAGELEPLSSSFG